MKALAGARLRKLLTDSSVSPVRTLTIPELRDRGAEIQNFPPKMLTPPTYRQTQHP